MSAFRTNPKRGGLRFRKYRGQWHDVLGLFVSTDSSTVEQLAQERVGRDREERKRTSAPKVEYWIIRFKSNNLKIKQRIFFRNWKLFWWLLTIRVHVRVVLRREAVAVKDSGAGIV